MIAGLIAAYVGAVGVGRRAVWRRRTVESVGRADAKRPAGTRSRRRRESDSEGVQREPERRHEPQAPEDHLSQGSVITGRFRYETNRCAVNEDVQCSSATGARERDTEDGAKVCSRLDNSELDESALRGAPQTAS